MITDYHRRHPMARYGYPGVEAEDPLNCPSCGGHFDARFWGNATVSFMLRNGTYAHDSGLMCPECKTMFGADPLMRHNAEDEGV